jgi:hypothetical protein
MKEEQSNMKHRNSAVSLKSAAKRALAATLTVATAALPAIAAAQEPVLDTTRDDTYHYASGWSLNLTPVLLFAHQHYRFGGGGDPELKYTADLGHVRLSAGARVGAYYAKNLFGLTAMPTLRVAMPTGDWEPYVAFGMGYGWLPEIEHSDIASMSRAGFVYHFSQRFALGVEGTIQKIDGSRFNFPSLGSMASFDF